MTDFAAARRTMVENQLRTYDVTDQRVLGAFGAIAREAFVEERQRAIAYLDRPLTARGGASTLLTPMVLARMLQALDVQPGENVLDVGSGAYGAALLANLGADVKALVGDAASAGAALAEAGISGVSVVAGPLAAGVSNMPHFDAVLIHAAVDAEPEALIHQLKDGGRLLAVFGRGRSGQATMLRRIKDTISRHVLFEASAPVSAEFAAKAAFQF